MVSADLPVILNLVSDALVASGGTLTPDASAELDALPLSVATSDGIIDMIKAAEKDEEDAKALAAPHAARAKAAAARLENLRAYLKRRMEAGKVDELVGARHSCRIQDGAPSITWAGSPETIPLTFRKEPKIELDPNAVKLAYSRKSLPAGFTVTAKKTLVIVG